ncbi:MAG: type 1 glutamine amidotransferase domain-containing protein, partial [Bacteriovoracaceae bacterium]|nr:type 1 glutamine amidotransferase domain-containing protein [Bacteriovoracaceae bacterium]
DTKRFKDDKDAQEHLANTKVLSTINADDYDTIFYPGGHGPMWDLAEDKDSIRLIEDFYNKGKYVGAVCHSPAALVNAKNKDGEPIVSGKRVTGFTNSEEEAVGLKDDVPFLLENKLKERGGKYEKRDDWEAFSIVDGNLITGQNPASSKMVAEEIISHMN